MKKQLYNRQCKTKHNLSHHLTIKALKHFGHQEHLCEFYSTGQAWRHTVSLMWKNSLFMIYFFLNLNQHIVQKILNIRNQPKHLEKIV